MNRRLWYTSALMAASLVAAAGFCAAQEPPAGPPASKSAAAPSAPAQTSNSAKTAGTQPAPESHTRQPTTSEARRATKLYLAAAKLYENGQFEPALAEDEEAAALDPANQDYRLAAEIARSHAVTALIQAAAKKRMQGDATGARAVLTHAFELDPHNPELAQHLNEVGEPPARDEAAEQRERATSNLGGLEEVAPAAGARTFHLHTNQRELIRSVFKAYGIEATTDESITAAQVRFDVDDATFEEATRALSMVTVSFFVPLDAHRVLVAKDTRDNRSKYTRNGVETLYLGGLTATEMTDFGNMARNVFEVNQAAVDASAATLTLRAPESQLDAFNTTFSSLMSGRSQVLLDVRLIQIAHTRSLTTGVQPPQQITAFNVYSEEQSILNTNQDLVQQIISSGLAAPGDTTTILGILLASGQVSSSLLQGGIILFGGGLTLSGISPQPITANFNLNSSDSRQLDIFQLRLGDGEEGTLKSGTRYPIQTSSFSSLGSSNLSIPGLNTAGSSSSLSGLLGGLSGVESSVPNIPMVQYEDLGLTLKATPSVMRSGDVALKLDMKITALAGSSINGVPVLANRAWTGVVTVPQNQGVVVASEMDRTESRAISGMPGLSEIPGLNNITSNDRERDDSTLLIIITPHVVRSPRMADHTRMVRIERNSQTR